MCVAVVARRLYTVNHADGRLAKKACLPTCVEPLDKSLVFVAVVYVWSTKTKTLSLSQCVEQPIMA